MNWFIVFRFFLKYFANAEYMINSRPVASKATLMIPDNFLPPGSKYGAPGQMFSSKRLSAESEIVRRFGPMTIRNMSSLKSTFHFTLL